MLISMTSSFRNFCSEARDAFRSALLGGIFLLQPFGLAFEVVDLVAQTFILLSGLGQLFVLILHRYMGFVYSYKVTKNLRYVQ